ncbi:MAG: tyrosine-type recombinase/integrase, partial [Gammaproteobacteria bacterium]|nr:tyrosine-type recombinase/integrase [Gammaproteobacteria bacterium]
YYANCLNGLLFFAEGQPWPEPAQLTRQHLRDFMDYLSNEPRRWAGDGRRATCRKASPGTVHHYIKVTKTFLNWCLYEDYLTENPALRLRLPPASYKEIEPYSDDELKAMLAALEHEIKYGQRYLGLRNKAIIAVFIDTGLRLTELTEMKLSEMDPQLRLVRVLGKGAKMRLVPLNGEARKILKAYLTQYRPAGGDRVWLTDDGEVLQPRSVQIMIDRLQRQAGVTSGGGAHRFRHYYATRYLENGGDMNSLRVLLGHNSLSMVLKYTKFFEARKDIGRAQEFSPFDSLLQRGCHSGSRPDGWGFRQKGVQPEGWRQ